jgi:acetylornithine deacetylase/succinyl-diaminopimelate desuccinylase-like protein
VDATRVLERLEELYVIGGGPGANRPSGSAEEDQAHALVADWLAEAGLDVEIDESGNLFGHAGGPVWSGSHLDSVPHGGRFDGPLGVVAAIEAVAAAGRGSVVAFRGEEVGCLGSRALVARGSPRPAAFVELHIEQGPRLAARGAPLGVVTSIVGLARGEYLVEGVAGHAGTTPMAGRRDALVGAAELVLRIRDTAAAIEDAVATVGELEVEPGAVNVIPSRVRLGVDARAPDAERFDRLVAELGFEPTYRMKPVELAPRLRALLREEVERLGLPVVELHSGAGHDAGVLAAAGIPSAMLFVRSLNGGVSHSPDELSSKEDIELALDVLTETLRRA